VVEGVEYCDEYFGRIFGVSKDKMRSVRRLIVGGLGAETDTQLRPLAPRVRYNQCVGFWREFFTNCQRPNDQTRLFPVNENYAHIYETHFSEWFHRVFPGEARQPPCLAWFMSARHDDEFKDVKDRPMHHHCRCPTCANLQARRLQAFNSAYEQEQYKLEWQDHQNEKRGWREFEASCVMSARHNPRNIQCLWFDDTEAIGFPKFTKRPMKNLPTARLQMIPFLLSDLARGRLHYVYTVKNRF
jgi:hypothetical protein